MHRRRADGGVARRERLKPSSRSSAKRRRWIWSTAHKGGTIGWTYVTGKPAHSSQPDKGVNAVMIAAELIAEINRIAEEMRSGPTVEGIDPPFSTIQVNQVEGGRHGNILAEHCKFFWEMRLVPGDSAERCWADDGQRGEARARHEGGDPSTGISIEVQGRIPALKHNDDPEIEASMLRMLGCDEARSVAYGTEAGIFQQAGIPSVIIGPGGTGAAHQPDEAISRDQLDRCVDFLGRVADTCR